MTPAAPGAAAIRWAASSSASRTTPPRRIAVRSPVRRAAAAAPMASVVSAVVGSIGSGTSWRPASPQAESCGTMRVETPEGGPTASRTASVMALAPWAAAVIRWTCRETGNASDSMSAVRGASAARCQLAWSPTRFTTGVCARRALCRLAMPLANPGPRCVRVSAGSPVTRPYPSAAPVATPSKRQSTLRSPSTSSRAATSSISVVPGLAKQTSTPRSTAVLSASSAPFMAWDGVTSTTVDTEGITMATDTNLELRSTVTAHGAVRLSLEESPVPEPGPDEVVIRVGAAPIKPSDLGVLL